MSKGDNHKLGVGNQYMLALGKSIQWLVRKVWPWISKKKTKTSPTENGCLNLKQEMSQWMISQVLEHLACN